MFVALSRREEASKLLAKLVLVVQLNMYTHQPANPVVQLGLPLSHLQLRRNEEVFQIFNHLPSSA